MQLKDNTLLRTKAYINGEWVDGMILTEVAPFGGVKKSGIGREG